MAGGGWKKGVNLDRVGRGVVEGGGVEGGWGYLH